MTNQDFAFIAVCGLCAVIFTLLWQAWNEVIKYRRRALRAELESLLLSAHADCSNAEILALKSELFDANNKQIRVCEACATYPCKCE